jgi:hypothetical protein
MIKSRIFVVECFFMETPVLFLIFNRPETTESVFASIQKARPSALYIAADGPRENHPSDTELCERTRSVVGRIDWDCQVHKLFRKTNLGCRQAVSEAISWFFEHEEMGIILEDDCLPHASFFSFCSVMLERYKTDQRIAHIGGANFQDGIKRGTGDYYYSNLTHVWGWASWRRVWKNYDVSMSLWETFRSSGYLKQLFPDKKVQKHLTGLLDRTFSGRIDTWDFQLFFTNLINGGLSVIPNVNLVSNIGFAPNATHPVKKDANANRPTSAITGYNPPEFFIPCGEADLYTLQNSFAGKTSLILRTIRNRSKKFFHQKPEL